MLAYWLAVAFCLQTVVVRDESTTVEWKMETQRWRESRDRSLRAPDGWLAVSGLFYVQPGRHDFGSGVDCAVRLTAQSSPPLAGTLHVTTDQVTFTAADGVSLLLNGTEAQQGQLKIDLFAGEADSADRLQVGTTTLQLIRRSGRLAVRLRDSQNPLRLSFRGEQWYPIQDEYRVEAKWVPYTEQRLIQIENVKGGVSESRLAGRVEFELQGQHLKLDVLEDSADSLMIVFRDQTSGRDTYGAGRFLSFPIPQDSSVTLDFNRAYNPPCAWNPHTLCPLPPKSNHLPITVAAGARKPADP
jgi:uncharacterized protein (DUF1684 family)